MATEEQEAWDKLASECGLSSRQALRLGIELAEHCGRIMQDRTPTTPAPGMQRDSSQELMHSCREIIRLGSTALEEQSLSVPLREAAQATLAHKQQRRPRTLYEIRIICARLQRMAPDFMNRQMRAIKRSDCQHILQTCFNTDRQRQKARLILHGIFAYGIRQGWCAANPLQTIDLPKPREQEIHPLPWEDLKKLLRVALTEKHRTCMPALGMMLWAGVRPAEVRRLSWQDVDWEERVISIRPAHSKTGGCRHITLPPALEAWLQEYGIRPEGRICPPNWERRWKELRRTALPHGWQQDVLRHTYASYHAKHWHDFNRLQAEMGHRSARLLQTRYLSMRGITAAHAARFWKPHGLWTCPAPK